MKTVTNGEGGAEEREEEKEIRKETRRERREEEEKAAEIDLDFGYSWPLFTSVRSVSCNRQRLFTSHQQLSEGAKKRIYANEKREYRYS
ncbi:uncharacterized protein V6R79_001092 [Siganus canaliculatus]